MIKGADGVYRHKGFFIKRFNGKYRISIFTSYTFPSPTAARRFIDKQNLKRA